MRVIHPIGLGCWQLVGTRHKISSHTSRGWPCWGPRPTIKIYRLGMVTITCRWRRRDGKMKSWGGWRWWRDRRRCAVERWIEVHRLRRHAVTIRRLLLRISRRERIGVPCILLVGSLNINWNIYVKASGPLLIAMRLLPNRIKEEMVGGASAMQILGTVLSRSRRRWQM